MLLSQSSITCDFGRDLETITRCDSFFSGPRSVCCGVNTRNDVLGSEGLPRRWAVRPASDSVQLPLRSPPQSLISPSPHRTPHPHQPIACCNSRWNHSGHHYSPISYLGRAWSINPWIPPQLDSGLGRILFLFFLLSPPVNPRKHLSPGTLWCIVWCTGECSLSCFPMRATGSIVEHGDSCIHIGFCWPCWFVL